VVAHQARLTRENIAVACSRNGLCAIFFGLHEVQEAFLKYNPKLRNSLITGGPQGAVLWLRCPDAITATINVLGAICWLGVDQAIVVSGRGPLEPAYKILNLAKPVEVPFEEIVWAEPMRIEIILHSTASKHGGPTTQDPRNRTIPNWDYWARCFALINNMRYDIARESFFQLLPNEIQLLPNERVLCMISEFLSNYGRQERFVILLKYRQPRFLKEFLALLRIVTAQSRDPEDDLEKFLAAALEPCHGADVSTAELNAMHRQHFRAKNLPPYPTPVFEKRVPAYIERLFRGVRSRKIQRCGKYCRGFNHVRIKRRGCE